jgi:hypothetical protein
MSVGSRQLPGRRRAGAAGTALLLATAILLVAWTVPARGDHPYAGRLQIRHVDDPGEGVSKTRYRLIQGGRSYRLLPDEAPAIPSGRRVVVRGEKDGGTIEGEVAASGESSAYAYRPSLGPRKVAAVLLNFESDPYQPWTPEHVRRRIFTDPNSTNAFYREQSYERAELVGRDRADGDVYGWYTISAPRNSCDVDLWTARADEAAAAAGADLSGYDHLMYFFPYQSSCGWAGLGELPGKYSWMNGYLAVSVVGHELGHNLGLHHASSWSCSSEGRPVAVGNDCDLDEYGDPFDVMGDGRYHTHTWHLQKLRYLDTERIQTVTRSGTYTVRTAVSPSAETQLLRIPRLRSSGLPVGDYYHLELRAPGGLFDDFAPTDPAVRGVTIRLNKEPDVIARSKLVDATPGSGQGFSDAPLPVGATFSDGVIGVRTTAVSDGRATVEVSIPDTAAPSVPTNLRGEFTDGAVRLLWEPSSDDVGIAGYLVYRDGVEVATTSTAAYDDTAVQPGSSYSYEVAAFDAAGNRSPRTAAHVVSVPPLPPPSEPADVAKPGVRIVQPRSGRAVGRTATVLAVASDDRGVGHMELLIDGRRRQAVPGSTLRFRWKVPRSRRSRHVITVRAFDRSGKAGRATVHVRKRRR